MWAQNFALPRLSHRERNTPMVNIKSIWILQRCPCPVAGRIAALFFHELTIRKNNSGERRRYQALMLADSVAKWLIVSRMARGYVITGDQVQALFHGNI
jgi:hypothetical protein